MMDDVIKYFMENICAANKTGYNALLPWHEVQQN
jgi:hypothetical protein